MRGTWPIVPAVLIVATCLAPPAHSASSRQAQYAAAARAYGVPEKVLLGVSYLQSRWDTHAGLPSVDGGYGPMHLTSGARPRSSWTLARAARLTGMPEAALRSDPASNILGGAALLADAQRRLGAPPAADPAHWHGAVAAALGPEVADEVYATIRSGAARTTDDGHAVRLPPAPTTPSPRRPVETSSGRAECPRRLSCAWLPAPAAGRGKSNHSRWKGRRPIDYIVVHTGQSRFDTMIRIVRDPRDVSWHYTLRSGDGHIAQHVRTRDIAWHSGNWYVNSRSIGLEHEGYLARGGEWYTEAMYRASARLVRYLAKKYDIPLDRAHILGHDNVPGITPSHVAAMHEDPGPYWDWAHYFTLLKAPLDRRAAPPQRTAGTRSPTAAQVSDTSFTEDPEAADPHLGVIPEGAARRGRLAVAMSGAEKPRRRRAVMILPDYDTHRPAFTGCRPARPGRECPSHGASSVWLHTAPAEDAPLVKDIGKHRGGESTRSVYDHAARVSTGQVYALAGRRGDWTAIWYLGQRAWFHDPRDSPVSVPVRAATVTPRPGRAHIPVYGRAYPERSAYPPGVPFQRLVPLQYRLPAGQRYPVGMTVHSSYLHTAGRQALVTGDLVYYQIQFGHRVMFVKAEDVTIFRN